MKKVTVYTTTTCPFCVRAKELLKRKQIPFTEVTVGWDDEAAWKAMEQRSGGMKTVPQIFFDDECIGGFTDLAAIDAKGELSARLES
jgi:glutaredoxin 3